MQFLKTIFWVILAVLIAIFATANWKDVSLVLWSDLRLAVRLPVLLAVTFALGFVPTMLFYRARLWNLKKKLGLSERNLAQSPHTPPPPAAPPRTPVAEPKSPFEAY